MTMLYWCSLRGGPQKYGVTANSAAEAAEKMAALVYLRKTSEDEGKIEVVENSAEQRNSICMVKLFDVRPVFTAKEVQA
jgi:hypothetical protein